MRSRAYDLPPGELRHRVIIQQVTRSADGRGGNTEVWATFATVYARVEPLVVTERLEHGQVQAEASHRVTVRWIDGVRPGMRIVWGSRTLEIRGVRNMDERRRVITLDCDEERI